MYKGDRASRTLSIELEEDSSPLRQRDLRKSVKFPNEQINETLRPSEEQSFMSSFDDEKSLMKIALTPSQAQNQVTQGKYTQHFSIG